MIYLINKLYSKLRSLRFYTELKQLFRLAVIVFLVFYIYNNRQQVATALFSEKGMTWAAFTLLSIVLALVIKIYYRMIIIKYYEKDTRIRLYENIADRERAGHAH